MVRLMQVAGVLAALVAGLAAAAAEETASGTLIERVLPPFRIGAVLCVEGSFAGMTLDVDDWHRPLRGTRPAEMVDGLPSLPTQVRDQPVRRLQVLLKQVKREFDGDDRLYEFRLLVELDGAAAPMTASGDCSYRSRSRVMDPAWTLKATTTAMRCGIDCDGGGVDLARVPGTGGLDLTFTETGIRMSGACFGAQYRVGALRRDLVSGEPLPEQPKPPSFRLHRTSRQSCEALAGLRD